MNATATRIKWSKCGRMNGGVAATRGFTLLEIILATMVLALGLAIAFASLHSANASVQRAELAASRNEHLRAVQGFLYRTLQSAQPLVLDRDLHSQQVSYLKGTRDKLQFVTSMPGYMSRGGPYALTLKLAPSAAGDGQRLLFSYAMLVKEQALADDAKRPPEELLDGITEGHFEYRALGPDAKIGPWQTKWDRSAELPLQIRLRLRFADPARVWPEFTTALPLGFARARAEDTGFGANPPVIAPTGTAPVNPGGGK
jgi:general secretion pathway protein J